MKKLFFIIILVLVLFSLKSQNIGISDNPSFNPSFMLHIQPSVLYGNDLFSIQNNLGTYYLHVKLNGKVGIGTNSPNTLVDVVGGANGIETSLLTLRSNFSANGTATGLRLINSTSSSSNVGAELISYCVNSGNGRSDLFFRVHGGGGTSGALLERMRILGNGQVCVNTSTPVMSDDVLTGYANSSSLAWGLAGYHVGTNGGGGFFQIVGTTNGYNAGESWTDGTGVAFLAGNTNTSNNMIGVWAQTSAGNSRYGLYSPNRCISLQWLVISDGRLKQNVKKMGSTLDKVLKLTPVTYNFDNTLEFGFLTQDVENIFPNIVYKNGVYDPEIKITPKSKIEASNFRYDAMNYIGLIPILVKAIQEQQIEIEKLKEELKTLK